ncbi:hypothetical protein BIY28_20840 [Brenneria goodwinii]|nr:hypothetical protein BIY28_20840 [Brenneria goodwinii]
MFAAAKQPDPASARHKHARQTQASIAPAADRTLGATTARFLGMERVIRTILVRGLRPDIAICLLLLILFIGTYIA